MATLANTVEAAILALDLTERRRVEANLRASEERFRTAFATSAIGLAIIGLDGRFLEVNDTACSIAGCSRDQLLTMRFGELTHPADPAENQRLFEELLRNERSGYIQEK